MKTISIDLPDFIDLNPLDIKFIIASKLYEQGRLSLGEASELAGISKRTLIELLGNYGVSIFNQDPKEIKDVFLNA